MLHHPHSVDDLALFIRDDQWSTRKNKPAPIVLADKLLYICRTLRAQIDAIWADTDHPHPDPSFSATCCALSADLDSGGAEFRPLVMYEGRRRFQSALRALWITALRLRATG